MGERIGSRFADCSNFQHTMSRFATMPGFGEGCASAGAMA
jgi:hypothetical protein